MWTLRMTWQLNFSRIFVKGPRKVVLVDQTRLKPVADDRDLKFKFELRFSLDNSEVEIIVIFLSFEASYSYIYHFNPFRAVHYERKISDFPDKESL